MVDHAIKRLKEEKSAKNIFSKSSGVGYKEMVKTFVTFGNRINDHDVAKVEKSQFAFPESILKQIHGETKMSWTGFVAKMKDGKQFAFATSYFFDFFSMPQGYLPEDIIEIINHTYLDRDGNMKSYRAPEVYQEFDRTLVYRERPFFECYMDNL